MRQDQFDLSTLSSQVNPAIVKCQNRKWHKWYANWLKSQTTPTEEKKCSDWLLGMGLSESTKSEPLSECHREDFQGQKVNKYYRISKPSTMETMETT